MDHNEKIMRRVMKLYDSLSDKEKQIYLEANNVINEFGKEGIVIIKDIHLWTRNELRKTLKQHQSGDTIIRKGYYNTKTGVVSKHMPDLSNHDDKQRLHVKIYNVATNILCKIFEDMMVEQLSRLDNNIQRHMPIKNLYSMTSTKLFRMILDALNVNQEFVGLFCYMQGIPTPDNKPANLSEYLASKDLKKRNEKIKDISYLLNTDDARKYDGIIAFLNKFGMGPLSRLSNLPHMDENELVLALSKNTEVLKRERTHTKWNEVKDIIGKRYSLNEVNQNFDELIDIFNSFFYEELNVGLNLKRNKKLENKEDIVSRYANMTAKMALTVGISGPGIKVIIEDVSSVISEEQAPHKN